MKLRSMLKVGAIAVVALYVVGSYLAFMDYRSNVAQNGTYTVSFQARFDPTSVMGSAPFTVSYPSIKLVYDRHPAYPEYTDWFFSQFHPRDSVAQDNGSALYTIHVKVSTVVKEKITHVLLDQFYYIYPNTLTSKTLVLNETLGPYLAYNSTLPMKAVFTIDITGIGGMKASTQGATYVTEWRE